jgi:hypothetical protein
MSGRPCATLTSSLRIRRWTFWWVGVVVARRRRFDTPAGLGLEQIALQQFALPITFF